MVARRNHTLRESNLIIIKNILMLSNTNKGYGTSVYSVNYILNKRNNKVKCIKCCDFSKAK